VTIEAAKHSPFSRFGALTAACAMIPRLADPRDVGPSGLERES